MADVGTFTAHPELKPLPALVRRQRTLEAKIAPLAPLVEDEKTLRAEIDALLIAAKIAKGDHVTCNGYDVGHTGRKGATSLNADALGMLLVLGGVDPEFVDFAVAACQETAQDSFWATVKPSKGAKVRK